MIKKLSELVNIKGKEYFTFAKRTNHFVVLGISTFSESYEIIEEIKKVKEVKFYKLEDGCIWIRISGSLNKFIDNVQGTIEIKDFDRFDKELWIWYLENETTFRYRWIIIFLLWRAR